MDLLSENRSLIHAGKLLSAPHKTFEGNSWSELFVLLFDNYCVWRYSSLQSIYLPHPSGYDETQGRRWGDQVLCQLESMLFS